MTQIIPILNKIQNSKTGNQKGELTVDPKQKVSYQFWPYTGSLTVEVGSLVF